MIPAVYMSNRNGFPLIESTGVTVTADAVVYNFRRHQFFNAPFTGGFYVKISQAIPTGTTATLPIVFTTEGLRPTNVTVRGGGNLLVSAFEGTGVYEFFHDSVGDNLQLM